MAEEQHRFADLHCHPGSRAYQRLRNTKLDGFLNPEFNPWNTGKANEKSLAKGSRSSDYAESDFLNQTKGNEQLVFASLYPMEKGFFMGNHHFNTNSDTVTDVVSRLGNGGIVPKVGAFFFKLFLKTKVNVIVDLLLNNQGPFRDIAQGVFMKFTMSRINFFQSHGYNYWQELLYEKQFYDNWNRRKCDSHYATGSKQYQIASNALEVDDLIKASTPSEKKIAVVLTVEGSHSFTMTNDLKLEKPEEIDRRIELMRSWNIFFITFSHHFANGLCGHAHSLPDELAMIADQTFMMNAEFNDEGKRVIKKILGLNRDLTDNGDRRIIIDVKHMSARSRKQYYADIVHPYNQNASTNNTRKIPVIASHCGHSGRKTLDDLIANDSTENNLSAINDLYAWNINLCDEDVVIIVSSGGLIGLSFDQRILGESRKDLSEKNKSEWAHRAWINIRHFLDGGAQNNSFKDVWKCISIGTDFDGMIDPLDSFPTASQFSDFAAALENEMKKPENSKYFSEVSTSTAISQLAFTNAYEFVVKHF